MIYLGLLTIFVAISVAIIWFMRHHRPMITGAQIRAARAMLGWHQKTLAEKTSVAVNTIRQLELDSVDCRRSTVLKVRSVLENAGIEFIPEDGGKGVGVRFRSSKSFETLTDAK